MASSFQPAVEGASSGGNNAVIANIFGNTPASELVQEQKHQPSLSLPPPPPGLPAAKIPAAAPVKPAYVLIPPPPPPLLLFVTNAKNAKTIWLEIKYETTLMILFFQFV
jgi:hypothetical protein